MTGRTPLACLVILAALATVLVLGPASASASTSACIEGISGCPSISVSKYGPSYVNAGEQGTFYFDVYNTGNVPLDNVTVNDDKCSPVTGPTGDAGNDGILLPYTQENGYEYWEFTCTYTLNGSPGDIVTDTVTATGDDGATTVSDQDSHDTTLTALHITKTVDMPTADPFDVLTYTITVTNDGPNNFSYNAAIDDQGCQDLQDAGNGSTDWDDFTLDPGQSATFTCHYDYFNPGPNDNGQYTNEACVDAYPYDNEIPKSVQTDELPPLISCADATTTLATHSVTGKVFEDMNADGAEQSGEPALPGVTVYVDLNNNGQRDSGEPSTTSGSDGSYTLPVDLGTSTIREEPSGNLTCSFPAGCAYTVDLPQNAPKTPPEDLRARPAAHLAANPSGKDFGDWRPASVSGTVVGDQNANGSRDAGESGLAGQTVYADLNGNGAPDAGEPTATTAADGTYTIGGLKPGSYVIRTVVPAGDTCTAPAGCDYSLSLLSNGVETNKDFLDAPPPAQIVLPARIVPGLVHLAGKTGCVFGSGFYARVRGRQIQRVTISIDGRTVKSTGSLKDNTTFRYRVNVLRLKVGSHSLTARVVFKNSSHTKTKTLRLSFQRCARQLVAPKFTG
jgi:hypothetical protein